MTTISSRNKKQAASLNAQQTNISDRLDTRLASLDPEVQLVKHEEIAKRYERKQKGFWSWNSWLKRRLNEIELVLWDRYADRVLPDDDAGRDDLRIFLHHQGRCVGGKNASTMRAWIAEHAAWLDEDEGDQLIRHYIASEKKLPKADTLARFMGLTYADRERLGRLLVVSKPRSRGIRTIGAIDASKAKRKVLNEAKWLELAKARAAAARRAAGAKPHAESASRTKPWEAFGYSRSTWERKGKPMPQKPVDENSSDIISRRLIRCDEISSPRKRLVSRVGEVERTSTPAARLTASINLTPGSASLTLVMSSSRGVVIADRCLAAATIPCDRRTCVKMETAA
jgi:hypothetical protein